MDNQANIKIVLHAGDYAFASTGTQMHTLLGSCVSITLWHPQLKIGGMCHYALPYHSSVSSKQHSLDGRYGEDCLKMFVRSARAKGTNLREYQAKIFGGGNMYDKSAMMVDGTSKRQPVGHKNVVAAYELLTAHHVDIHVAHVGEFGYRQIIFDVATGDVWVKFSPITGKANASTYKALNGCT